HYSSTMSIPTTIQAPRNSRLHGCGRGTTLDIGWFVGYTDIKTAKSCHLRGLRSAVSQFATKRYAQQLSTRCGSGHRSQQQTRTSTNCIGTALEAINIQKSLGSELTKWLVIRCFPICLRSWSSGETQSKPSFE